MAHRASIAAGGPGGGLDSADGFRGQQPDYDGGHPHLHHCAGCRGGCRGDRQTGRQPGVDDHLHVSVELCYGVHRAISVPAHRPERRHQFLAVVPGHPLQGVHGAAGAHAGGLRGEALHAQPSRLDSEHRGPLVLHVGHVVEHRHRLHGEVHRARRHHGGLCAGHRADLVPAVHCAVCLRTLCGAFLARHHRERTGPWTEKHGVCRVDCLHLPEPAVLGGPWLLHPVAKRH